MTELVIFDPIIGEVRTATQSDVDDLMLGAQAFGLLLTFLRKIGISYAADIAVDIARRKVTPGEGARRFEKAEGLQCR